MYSDQSLLSPALQSQQRTSHQAILRKHFQQQPQFSNTTYLSEPSIAQQVTTEYVHTSGPLQSIGKTNLNSDMFVLTSISQPLPNASGSLGSQNHSQEQNSVSSFPEYEGKTKKRRSKPPQNLNQRTISSDENTQYVVKPVNITAKHLYTETSASINSIEKQKYRPRVVKPNIGESSSRGRIPAPRGQTPPLSSNVREFNHGFEKNTELTSYTQAPSRENRDPRAGPYPVPSKNTFMNTQKPHSQVARVQYEKPRSNSRQVQLQNDEFSDTQRLIFQQRQFLQEQIESTKNRKNLSRAKQSQQTNGSLVLPEASRPSTAQYSEVQARSQNAPYRNPRKSRDGRQTESFERHEQTTLTNSRSRTLSNSRQQEYPSKCSNEMFQSLDPNEKINLQNYLAFMEREKRRREALSNASSENRNQTPLDEIPTRDKSFSVRPDIADSRVLNESRQQRSVDRRRFQDEVMHVMKATAHARQERSQTNSLERSAANSQERSSVNVKTYCIKKMTGNLNTQEELRKASDRMILQQIAVRSQQSRSRSRESEESLASQRSSEHEKLYRPLQPNPMINSANLVDRIKHKQQQQLLQFQQTMEQNSQRQGSFQNTQKPPLFHQTPHSVPSSQQTGSDESRRVITESTRNNVYQLQPHLISSREHSLYSQPMVTQSNRPLIDIQESQESPSYSEQRSQTESQRSYEGQSEHYWQELVDETGDFTEQMYVQQMPHQATETTFSGRTASLRQPADMFNIKQMGSYRVEDELEHFNSGHLLHAPRHNSHDQDSDQANQVSSIVTLGAQPGTKKVPKTHFYKPIALQGYSHITEVTEITNSHQLSMSESLRYEEMERRQLGSNRDSKHFQTNESSLPHISAQDQFGSNPYLHHRLQPHTGIDTTEVSQSSKQEVRERAPTSKTHYRKEMSEKSTEIAKQIEKRISKERFAKPFYSAKEEPKVSSRSNLIESPSPLSKAPVSSEQSREGLAQNKNTRTRAELQQLLQMQQEQGRLLRDLQHQATHQVREKPQESEQTASQLQAMMTQMTLIFTRLTEIQSQLDHEKQLGTCQHGQHDFHQIRTGSALSRNSQDTKHSVITTSSKKHQMDQHRSDMYVNTTHIERPKSVVDDLYTSVNEHFNLHSVPNPFHHSSTVSQSYEQSDYFPQQDKFGPVKNTKQTPTPNRAQARQNPSQYSYVDTTPSHINKGRRHITSYYPDEFSVEQRDSKHCEGTNSSLPSHTIEHQTISTQDHEEQVVSMMSETKEGDKGNSHEMLPRESPDVVTEESSQSSQSSSGCKQVAQCHPPTFSHSQKNSTQSSEAILVVKEAMSRESLASPTTSALNETVSFRPQNELNPNQIAEFLFREMEKIKIESMKQVQDMKSHYESEVASLKKMLFTQQRPMIDADVNTSQLPTSVRNRKNNIHENDLKSSATSLSQTARSPSSRSQQKILIEQLERTKAQRDQYAQKLKKLKDRVRNKNNNRRSVTPEPQQAFPMDNSQSLLPIDQNASSSIFNVPSMLGGLHGPSTSSIRPSEHSHSPLNRPKIMKPAEHHLAEMQKQYQFSLMQLQPEEQQRRRFTETDSGQTSATQSYLNANLERMQRPLKLVPEAFFLAERPYGSGYSNFTQITPAAQNLHRELFESSNKSQPRDKNLPKPTHEKLYQQTAGSKKTTNQSRNNRTTMTNTTSHSQKAIQLVKVEKRSGRNCGACQQNSAEDVSKPTLHLSLDPSSIQHSEIKKAFLSPSGLNVLSMTSPTSLQSLQFDHLFSSSGKKHLARFQNRLQATSIQSNQSYKETGSLSVKEREINERINRITNYLNKQS